MWPVEQVTELCAAYEVHLEHARAQREAEDAARRKKIGLAVTATDGECVAREKQIAEEEAARLRETKDESQAHAEFARKKNPHTRVHANMRVRKYW